MKRALGILAVLLVGLSASCHYEFTAAPKSDLPTDGAFRGTWVKLDNNQRAVLSVATTTDGYFIAHCRGDHDDGLIYRAYPLAKDLPDLLQIEVLDSSAKGDVVNVVNKERFTIAKVVVDHDKLTWSVIDPQKAGPAKNGAALLETLRAAQAGKKDLFNEPQTYNRVKDH